ncbi:ComEA family DNA-binding protein [Candidatus Laterigemmans baculatus]|uniref:ComEA family DNA-binding protein n=1 Tax=Candidatus Laterigemmans baculatus TaxID=2770505 RepID=UPI00193BE616|nr:helix-hairpin-helix domain-containing protein [Candidatus Laterigemmans baculatus]
MNAPSQLESGTVVDREEPLAIGDARGTVVALAAIVLAVCAWCLEATSRGAGEPQPAPVRLRLELNQASVEELMLLPGIGPELAGRIVEHRETEGPFDSLEALDAVHGIGPAKIAGVAPYLTVADEP